MEQKTAKTRFRCYGWTMIDGRMEAAYMAWLGLSLILSKPDADMAQSTGAVGTWSEKDGVGACTCT